MLFSTTTALAAGILFASFTSAQLIPSPTFDGPMNAQSTIGCFSTPTPLIDHGFSQFQTPGLCQRICYQLQKPVMGLTSGTNCSCGDLLPPKDTKVESSKCNTPCNGYDQTDCGGGDYWWVILSGITRNQIDNLDPSSSSSSSAASTQTSASTIALSGTTIVKTVGSDPTGDPANQEKSGGGGPSTAGIAAGVVVGVVAIVAIIGGVFFFMRHRRRQAMEEEHRRQANVNQFVNGGKMPSVSSNTSMNDSRLDPEVMMARRQSDGSIADNADYSRRILKVTNPDGN
ncbi:hypothetical protein K402DRAFT_402931 [Aulographum hederae CBS 113979]|uniref:WSC domain-containing protein n=1 Tax=Aulographum hederae CBS 113979 TaxID=1176131 RepID=A0A6G1H5A9_9PEZI|nr:hypothetical protein K402DRAFT_402931 [Aulographum hederae CBS 113979]